MMNANTALRNFAAALPFQFARAVATLIDHPESLRGWGGSPFKGAEELPREMVGALLKLGMGRHFREGVPFIEVAREFAALVERATTPARFRRHCRIVEERVDSRHMAVKVAKYSAGVDVAMSCLAELDALKGYSPLDDAFEVETVAERAYIGTTPRCAYDRAMERARDIRFKYHNCIK